MLMKIRYYDTKSGVTFIAGVADIKKGIFTSNDRISKSNTISIHEDCLDQLKALRVDKLIFNVDGELRESDISDWDDAQKIRIEDGNHILPVSDTKKM